MLFLSTFERFQSPSIGSNADEVAALTLLKPYAVNSFSAITFRGFAMNSRESMVSSMLVLLFAAVAMVLVIVLCERVTRLDYSK